MTASRQREISSLDEIVEAYESRLASGEVADLADFVPQTDHPEYAAIVVELIRIDMENEWRRGNRRCITDYRPEFNAALDNPVVMQQVAFEEFRQRRNAGDPITRDEYAATYRVNVADWPTGASQDVDESASTGPAVDDLPIGSDDLSTQEVIHGWNLNDQFREQGFEAAEPPILAHGEMFAGCEILRELGRGASSRVYLARQRALANRLVALKISSRITREADRLARLQHTNIVPVYSTHQFGQWQALCMPYFGASTLSHWVQRLKSLDPTQSHGIQEASTVAVFHSGTWRPSFEADSATTKEQSSNREPKGTPVDLDAEMIGSARRHVSYEAEMLALAVPLARGLAHAHSHEILHLDLKPANILLTDDGRPMLLDFHLSVDPNDGRDSRCVVGGTLPYMSPEQIRSLERPEPIDGRSDLYSFGLVLFELLTGQLPFPLRTGKLSEIINVMLRDRQHPPPLTEVHPLVSPGMGAIVSRCLNPDPTRRYQRAIELAEDLERHQRNLPLHYAANPSLRERMVKWGRRHPRWTSGGAVTVAAALCLGLGGLIWTVREQRLARLEVAQTFADFCRDATEAKARLSLPAVDSQELMSGIDRSEQLLSRFDVVRNRDWRRSTKIQRLPPPQQRELAASASELLYLMSAAQLSHTRHETPTAQTDLQIGRALDWNTRAVACFERTETPSTLWLQRAELFERLQRTEEAKSARAEADRHANKTKFDRELEALHLTLGGDYFGAAALLERLLYDAPREFQLWFLAGACHFATHHFSEAEGCFSVCTSLQPDSYQAYYQRGVCRLKLGNFSGARGDFERAGQLLPGDLPALVSRALALRGEGRLQEAAEDLTQAINREFHETRIYFMRSDVYRQLGETELAEKDRSAGLRLIPDDPQSWVARGFARIDDDPEGALADFQQALQLDDRCYEAWRNVAHVQSERLNQTREAVATLDQLLKMTGDDPLAWSGRAVLLARQERIREARDDIEQALKLRRDPLVVYQAACVAALDQTDREAAGERALGFLAEALTGNLELAALAASDPDLSSLQARQDFQELLAAAQRISRGAATEKKVREPSPTQLPPDTEVIAPK